MIDRPLYIDKIKPYINTPFIKILTGIRRCGKSTILKMLMKKLEEELGVDHNHILSYRFDSFEYDGMTPKEIYEDIKAHFKDEKKYYLFLDEVQGIDNWEKMVNSIKSDYNTDIYITGSNSRMMSSEISTYLTGRYVSFKIFTLSFREYLDFAGKYTDVSDTRKAFMEYVKLGGFPGTHLHP